MFLGQEYVDLATELIEKKFMLRGWGENHMHGHMFGCYIGWYCLPSSLDSHTRFWLQYHSYKILILRPGLFSSIQEYWPSLVAIVMKFFRPGRESPYFFVFFFYQTSILYTFKSSIVTTITDLHTYWCRQSKTHK